MHSKKNRLISTAVVSVFTAFTGFSSTFLCSEAYAAAVTNTLPQAPVVQTDRLSGSDRYETAIAVSKANWTSSDYVVVVRGDDFPDGLCAGPLAYKLNAPILLNGKDSLDSRVTAEIKRLNPKKIYMLGGTGALSENVESDLNKIASTERIGGENRYATSVKIAEKLGTVSSAVIATGSSFVDSLSISSIAAMDNMPILLSSKDSLDSSVTNYLKTQSISKTFVVGGEGVLSSNIDKSVTNPQRLQGDDRYLTNLSVIKNFESQLNFNNLYLAPAFNDVDGFADALVGSVVAAKNKAPIALVGDKSINTDLSKYIVSKLSSASKITAFGGTAVVDTSLLTNLSASFIPKVLSLNTAGMTYGSEDASKLMNIQSADTDIQSDNVTLKNSIVNGDLHVHGNASTLNNLNVTGTLYIDPGTNGTATLNNVTASNVQVLSGATHSINIVDSNLGNVEVVAKDGNVRLVASGSTSIQNTKVASNAILETANTASFGPVTVSQGTAASNTVEFRGTFTGSVTVTSSATIVPTAGTNLKTLTLAGENHPTVTVDGSVASVDILNPTAVQFTNNANVTGKITAEAASEVTAPKTVTIPLLEVAPRNHAAVSFSGTLKLATILKPAALQLADQSTTGQVQVNAQAEVTAANNASVDLVQVAPENHEAVTLAGTLKSVDVLKPAQLQLADQTNITGQIKLEAQAELTAPTTAKVPLVQVTTKDAVQLTGNFNLLDLQTKSNVTITGAVVSIESTNSSSTGSHVSIHGSGTVINNTSDAQVDNNNPTPNPGPGPIYVDTTPPVVTSASLTDSNDGTVTAKVDNSNKTLTLELGDITGFKGGHVIFSQLVAKVKFNSKSHIILPSANFSASQEISLSNVLGYDGKTITIYNSLGYSTNYTLKIVQLPVVKNVTLTYTDGTNAESNAVKINKVLNTITIDTSKIKATSGSINGTVKVDFSSNIKSASITPKSGSAFSFNSKSATGTSSVSRTASMSKSDLNNYNEATLVLTDTSGYSNTYKIIVK